MIEESLVYICADAAGKNHIGCGVTIEGGLIATCRHVWAKAGDSPFVRFPRVNSAEALQRLTLVDDCQDEGDPPDCVLLRPALMPGGVLPVSLALKDRLETGEAECCAYLQRNKNWREVLVRGTIYETKGPDGRRQFSGQFNTGYWFAPGSSGSPLFKQGGQQLAAILSLSELGANDGKRLLEAFVVPASVMLKYVRRVQAKPITQPEHLSRAQLDEVLREIGAADVPSDEALARLKSFIQDAKAQAAEPLPIVAEGGDVPEVIAAAREKAGALDTAGAVQILEDRLAQESKAHEARMAALLREKAAIERLSFRREEAIATMLRLLTLAPAAPWDWINLGDLYRTQGRSTEARRAFEKALEAAEQQDPTSRDVGASHNKIGDILQAQGDLAEALAAYQRGMDIAERLAASDPSNARWQRDLSLSHNKIGDILQAQGNLAETLAAYQRGMDIRARLAASDPSNAGWQRDLSVSHTKIGDILQAQGNLAEALAAYQRSMEIRVRLAASDPSNAGWQRDLSVSHEKIGDILQAQGNLAGALAGYQSSIEIRARLAASDPTNTGWQRDLSISHNNIGDILRAQSNLAGALAAYQRGMHIAERLAASDPSNTGWQRDLSVSHNKIGDILQAQGNLAGALAADQRGMDIAERLAASDPSNTGWQRDLSISHEKIGDILQAQGNLAEALAAYQRGMDIAERLAASDPSNAGWQRDLSISHERIGDILQAQGNLAETLAAYQRGMDIRARLAASDPTNAEWQRDLSISHNKIGDILQAQGNLAEALAAYQRSMDIAERLAASDPTNAEWQRDLVVSLVLLGEAVPALAKEHLTRALAIVTSLAETDRLAPSDAWMIEDLTGRLRRLGD